MMNSDEKALQRYLKFIRYFEKIDGILRPRERAWAATSGQGLLPIARKPPVNCRVESID